MLISFVFSLWGCYMGPISTYELTHMGPMVPGCTPHMGSPYGTHIGMFAGPSMQNAKLRCCVQTTDRNGLSFSDFLDQ